MRYNSLILRHIENFEAKWSGRRPVYTRATILGFYLIAIASIVALLAGAVDQNTSLIIIGVVSLLASLGFSILLMRSGSWALVVSVILGLAILLLAFGPQIFEYGLNHPKSFFDFTPALLGGVGSVMVIVGGVAAFLQGRRPNPRIAATLAERAALGTLALALTTTVAISAVISIVARNTVSAQEAVGAIRMNMDRIRFEPEQLTLPSGQAVRMVIDNQDLVFPTFTIKELDIEHEFVGTAERIIELPPLAPGSYSYTCEVPGHEGMKGTLEVIEP